MSLMDVLSQYVNPTPASASTSQAHYDQVAKSVPPDVLGQGISETLRSEQTPPFGDMVAQLFGRSNPQQQAGVLNQILGSVGPGVWSGLAGGVLGRVFGNSMPPATAGGPADSAAGAATNTTAAATPSVTPEQASRVTPEQAGQIAAHAEQHDPGVVDKVGSFYAQHPDLVRGLGGMALAVLLGKMANR